MTTNCAMFLLPTVYSCLIFAILLPFSSAYGSDLTIGYYNNNGKCPGAEQTIRNAVEEAVRVAGDKQGKGLCAGVLRLHFHDSFVRGCDGSVLLNRSDANPNPEKDAKPNETLRGFEVIDAAKTAVEENCANVVSCADVLAFAARDCVRILGGFDYDVYAGRLDGNVSKAQDALDNLPAPFFNITQLESSFAKKNLTLEDLTVLSGGHSVGISHCSSFQDRVNSNDTSQINADYANALRKNCTVSDTVAEDYVTPDILDNQYFKNNLNNSVLFFSDWALRTNVATESYMELYANDPLNTLWKDKFKCAMQKMGQIIELAKGQGEIRKVCSAVNAY